MGPMASNQKSVLKATRIAIRPREPASRASDRQGSMRVSVGFWVLEVEEAGDPGLWVSERGGSCAPDSSLA